MFARTALFATFVPAMMLAAGAPAVAESPTVRSVQVRYDDLDLVSQKGERALMSRLNLAASKVCYITGNRDGAHVREYEDCRVAALAAAKANAGEAIAAARNGERLASARPRTLTVGSSASTD